MSIKDMCNLISIEEIAVKYGFVRNNSKTCRTGVVYDHDNGLRIAIVKSRKYMGQQHYTNVRDESEGGGLYTFIKNRIKDGTIVPLTNSFKENEVIASILREYLNLPEQEKKTFKEKIPEKKPNAPFDFAMGKMFLIPAINTTFLTQVRRISKDTFEHPLFKGTFFNCNKEIDSRRRGADIAFPCYRTDGTMGGINIRYYNRHKCKSASMFMVNSEHDKSVWHSNIPEKIERVFVSESELDCMAHFQLSPNPNTLYISHQGNLVQGQVYTIMELLKENVDKFTPNFKMMLGADNDEKGNQYDLMIICGAVESKADKSTVKCRIAECAAKQDGYKSHLITVRDDLYENFKNSCLNGQKSENMVITTDDERKTVIVSRPMGDMYADAALTSMILNSDLVNNIVKEKSMSKDWNDDLKLLVHINDQIRDMKMGKRMPYELFREKYTELSLQTKSTDHIREAINSIKEQLADITPTTLPEKTQEELNNKSGVNL